MWTFIATKAPGRPLARSADSPTSCSPESRVRRRLSPAWAGRLPRVPAGAPQRVDLDPLAARRAAQELVVGVLDARLADDVAGPQALVSRALQLARADLADEAQDVGGERAVRVLAHVGPLDADAGEALLVLEQVEEQLPVEALLEHHRVAGVLRGRAHPPANLALREAEELAELGELAPSLVRGRWAGPTGAARRVITVRLSTRTLPLRSRISPRGGWTRTSRTPWSLASAR